MDGLIWPTSIEFDDSGRTYVAESGYVYGDPFAPARVLRIERDSTISEYASALNGPVTGLLWHNGKLYISHRGKISTVGAKGELVDLVTGLPSGGDHWNNDLCVGPDGKIYFGQGTATNAGAVGLDNSYPYIWSLLHPEVHDVPARDVRLTATTFVTPHPANVLARQGKLTNLWSDVTYAVSSIFSRRPDRSMLVRTGAYQPFGHSAKEVKGETKASGTILRMDPDGSNLEVYAWGCRNPYGIGWGPDGELYVAENAFDERGSRPVAHAQDNFGG